MRWSVPVADQPLNVQQVSPHTCFQVLLLDIGLKIAPSRIADIFNGANHRPEPYLSLA
jgi:hypothetical protein